MSTESSWQRLIGGKKARQEDARWGHPYLVTLLLVRTVAAAVERPAAGAQPLPAPPGHRCATADGSIHADPQLPAEPADGSTAPAALGPRLSSDAAATEAALHALVALDRMLASFYNRLVFQHAAGVPTLAALLAAAAPGALAPDGALLQPPLALYFWSAVPRCSPPTVRFLCCCLQYRVAAGPLCPCVVVCSVVLLAAAAPGALQPRDLMRNKGL